MSARRNIILSLTVIVAVLVAALALAPILLRDQIEARVKTAIAGNINARVDWSDLDLGLLRTFPNLSLRLADLSVIGVDAFAGDTLLVVPRFRMVLDLKSVLGNLRRGDEIVVRAIDLQRPRAGLQVRADGSANWDIMKGRDSARAESKRGIDVSLKKLEIADALVTMDNQASQLQARIAGLDHSLSGDFSKRKFALKTQTSADTASLTFAGIPYLSSARVEADVDLDADMTSRTFTLRDNRIQLNDLTLNAAGDVVMASNDVGLDIGFNSPRTEFREILSLVPAVFTQAYSTVQTAGTMAVEGRVRGALGKHSFPAFAVRAHVQNGSFRYPDLPLPARDIQFQLRLTNPGGSADSTVVNVERLHVVLGNDPIDGSLVIRTPISDPLVALRLTGRLDLANIPRTVKLEDVKQLAGIVTANANMRARLSDVNQKRYDRVSANGRMEIQQLVLNAADLRQPLNIEHAVLDFTPQNAQLSSFRGRAGSSDLTMTGSLENVLGFALGREDLRGTATVSSRSFDLNEWRSDDELKSIIVPGHIDFKLNARADTVKYGTLTLHNARGALQIKDQRASLEDFRMDLLGGSMVMKGFYETRPDTLPAFDFAVDLDGVSPNATFAQIKTVQMFAPVAQYAEGRISAQMKLTGELGSNMMPVLTGLSGLGSLATNSLVLRGFPPLDRLANTLKVQQLQNPGFLDLKSSFAIDKGRLHVKPFDVRVGAIGMTITGSNGIDQTLDYDLAVKLPRSILGSDANQAITSIINRSQQAGFNLQSAETITLAVKLGGTIKNPAVATSFRNAAGDAGASVANAMRAEAERRQQEVIERVDSVADAARLRIIAEAEAKAAALRQEAATLANKLKSEGYMRADSLEARASGLAKIPAKAAADRLRREADAKANALLQEANTRAEALVSEAREQARATSSGN